MRMKNKCDLNCTVCGVYIGSCTFVLNSNSIYDDLESMKGDFDDCRDIFMIPIMCKKCDK